MANPKVTTVPPLVIIGALFFIFGFITWLNGTLIPFLKLACELMYAQALLVTFACYIAYVFLAIPSALILQKTGFKNGMALGLVVMAGGALVFVAPAPAHATYAGAVETLAYWKARGLPASKAVLGLPFYGQPSQESFAALLARGADPEADRLGG